MAFHFSAGITTAATQLTNSAVTLFYGATVKAAAANTGKVYLGYANTVTALTSAANDGFELSAGEAYYIPKNETGTNGLTNVYLIASTGTQTVTVIGS